MKRRAFIAALCGAVVWLLAARAQQPEPLRLIGVLTPAETDVTPIFAAFRRALSLLGYIEGRTIRSSSASATETRLRFLGLPPNWYAFQWMCW
jgi:hypothetical protein